MSERLYSSLTGSALTHETIHEIEAGAAILTWLIFTRIDGMLASTADKTCLTDTFEAIDRINAFAIIFARIGRTVVQIELTFSSTPTRVTNAFVMEESVHTNTVNTGTVSTQINLLMTSFASETERTLALEVIDQISTFSAQKTRLFSTIININVAVPTGPTRRTFTAIAAL